MFKKGLFLTAIFLLVFSIGGFTTDYKYTQESGVGFFVASPDKADALEDTCEIRQIVNDLGTLLGHSKMDGLYPKDLTTGGYLGRLNSGLDASKPAVPVVNDMYLATDTTKVYKCFVAGNWVQVYPITEVDPTVDTDAKIKAILVDEITKTGAFTAGRIVKINNATGIIEQGTNTDTNVADAITKKHTSGSETCTGDVSGTVGSNTVDKIKGHIVDETDIGDNKLLVYKTTGEKYVYETLDLSLYYLKTAIDTQGEMETIWGVTLATDTELAALKFTDLDDTPANYTGQAGKYIKVNAGETALEFGTPTGGAGTYLELTDTPAAYDTGKYAKSTADGVIWDTPTGGYTNLTSFVDQTAWRLFYSNNLGDVIELALGTDGQYLKSTGTTSAPIFDTPAGAGTVTTSGTPVQYDYARFTDATTIEGRSYAEVKTDLGFISDVVDDTTPELGGELDASAHSIGFTLQTATGDGTTTIDWRLGNKFKFTFGAQNDTFTFTAPTNPCTLMLTIIQDASGSRTITWPGTVKWAGGVAPTLTTTANARDKVALDWDGTQYDGVASLDFQ